VIALKARQAPGSQRRSLATGRTLAARDLVPPRQFLGLRASTACTIPYLKEWYGCYSPGLAYRYAPGSTSRERLRGARGGRTGIDYPVV
jgi:hypothetical protein